jgi:ABC-type Fe3+-hydroxamate transport system substrate-binding protein
VSLVPSDTHTVFALGCGDRVVGRTTYCVEPVGQVEAVAAVGGTKDVDVDAVAALEPDLVIANQEENTEAVVEALDRRRIPVLVSFPQRVSDGVAHLARMARVLGVEREPGAKRLVRDGYDAVRMATAEAAARPGVRTFAPIWLDPLMTFSAATYGGDVLGLVGGDNVFADRERRYPLAADLGKARPRPAGTRDTRYPRVTWQEVATRAPELVLLPDEPSAFGARAVGAASDELRAAGATDAVAVALCSGKDLFWYGAWTAAALPRLAALVAALR